MYSTPMQRSERSQAPPRSRSQCHSLGHAAPAHSSDSLVALEAAAVVEVAVAEAGMWDALPRQMVTALEAVLADMEQVLEVQVLVLVVAEAVAVAVPALVPVPPMGRKP